MLYICNWALCCAVELSSVLGIPSTKRCLEVLQEMWIQHCTTVWTIMRAEIYNNIKWKNTAKGEMKLNCQPVFFFLIFYSKIALWPSCYGAKVLRQRWLWQNSLEPFWCHRGVYVLTILLSCLHRVCEFWRGRFLRVQRCLFSAQWVRQ